MPGAPAGVVYSAEIQRKQPLAAFFLSCRVFGAEEFAGGDVQMEMRIKKHAF